MRLSVSLPCFYRELDFCEAIRRVHDLGFDAVETWDWKPLDLDRVRATCEELGVAFAGFCTSDFRLTDPAARDDWLRALEDSARAAVRAGAGSLITQSGPDTGAPRAVQHEAIATTLRAAESVLGEFGITLLLEPLNTRFDHPDTYLWSSAEGFELVRESEAPHVKILFDLYHMQIMEGNLVPTLCDNLPLVGHLHAAGHPGRHDLPDGETNYPAVFRALDAAGYAGRCGLEYFPVGDSTESLRACLRHLAEGRAR